MSYDPGTRHPKKTKKIDEADQAVDRSQIGNCPVTSIEADRELSDFASKYCIQSPNAFNGGEYSPKSDSFAETERGALATPNGGFLGSPKLEAVRGAQLTKGSGLKFDTGKEPMSLLSRRWLIGVTQVLGFGAKKYAAHNWRNGHERSRLISAAIRHILAYNEGEDVDSESGLNHLDHASCCLMFARETHETHPHLDDRWKGNKK